MIGYSRGTAYALSGRVATLLSKLPDGALRFLNNEGEVFDC